MIVYMIISLYKILIGNLIFSAAPNFGGLWEAVIKSTKFLLKRTLNLSAYTFEGYITFLLELKRS